jgi:molybdate transport system ATP-binding protein
MLETRIRKRFPSGADSAGFTLDLEMTTGSGVTALFGPSGAGKTLTLDCIAGFVTPDAGRILLDDELLFDGERRVSVPPRHRQCGYVFQNYALFPHMTLRKNLDFALRDTPRLERHRRINEMLQRFSLTDVSGQRPHEVSGGQQQRCSIARAIIRQRRLLLLDEPARGLDAPLRDDLYATIRQVNEDLGVPVLLVSHDLEECFALAGQMIILAAGRIVQSGSPKEIVNRPAGPDVARLLGIYNLLQMEVLGLDPGRNSSRLRYGDAELTGPYFRGKLIGDRITVCVRPDHLTARPREGRPGPNQIPATLLSAVETPGGVRLNLEGDLVVRMRGSLEECRRTKDWLIDFPPSELRAL